MTDVKMENRELLVKSFFMFHGVYAELKNNYEEFIGKAREYFEKSIKRVYEVPEEIIVYVDVSEDSKTYRWEFRDSESKLLFHLPAITDKGYFVINGESKVMLITEMRLRTMWYLTIAAAANDTIFCQCCINNSNIPVIIELKNSTTLQINIQMIYKDIEEITNEEYKKIEYVNVYNFLIKMLKLEAEDVKQVLKRICKDEEVLNTCLAQLFSGMMQEELIEIDIEEIGLVIRNKLFAGISEQKIMYTVLGMISCCTGVMLGKCKISDRDDYCMKRLCTPGETIFEMFKRYVNMSLKECQSKQKDARIFLVKLQSLIDTNIYTCLKRGEQIIAGRKYSKMAVQLSKRSIIDSISSVRRVQIPCDENSQNIAMRQIHSSQKGYICPCETPEGKPVGLIKHLAACCLISGPCEYIDQLISRLNIRSYTEIETETEQLILVNVDGTIHGWCSMQDALEWIKTVKDANPFVSCSIDKKQLLVRSVAGRPLMPVIKSDEDLHLQRKGVEVWREHVINGDIMYVDPVEYKRQSSTIELIHPCLILGLTAGMIPFPEHNQSSRNVFACAMIKQALQMQQVSNNTGKISCYLQKPLVSTLISRAIGYDETPYGLNLLTCIMSYTGFNQEDAIIIKKSSIDRGMFDYIVYKDEELTVDKPYEIIHGEDGIVSVLYGGAEQKLQHVEPMLSCPVFVEYNEKQLENKKWKLIIRYKEYRTLSLGDKLSSRHAQKGVIGLIANDVDMPFNSEGIIPDIIINPHAIPSRMTVGQLLEGVLGIDCCKCFNIELEDGTPFMTKDKRSIQALLSLQSTETMTLGTTGEEVQDAVVMGLVYYMCLAHQSADKIYVRGASGPKSLLSRQPVPGRSKGGGLRFGEMEYDCLIAHGSSKLISSISENSDLCDAPYCKNCNVFSDIVGHVCRLCGDHTDVKQIPFSLLVFKDGMLSASISTKVRYDTLLSS